MGTLCNGVVPLESGSSNVNFCGVFSLMCVHPKRFRRHRWDALTLRLVHFDENMCDV